MSLRSLHRSDTLEARQLLLDRRCERNKPKNHRTNKDKSVKQKSKNRIQYSKNIKRGISRKRWLKKSRDYWAGVADSHPS